MKKTLKLIAAALAAVTALSSASVTAFADKLKTVDGVTYRYSDSGQQVGKYTGWAKSLKGKSFYNNGIKVTKNTIINGIRYKFSADGYCIGKFTGLTKSSLGRRYWNNGELVKNKWLKANGYYYYAGIDGYIIVEKTSEKFPTLKAISASLEKSLCEQYINIMKLQNKYTVDDIEVVLYLGNYRGNDVAIIMPKGGLSQINLTNLESTKFGDVKITDPVGIQTFVSINNELVFLDLSYLDGYITDDDVIKINYYMNQFLASKGIDPTVQQNKYPTLTALTEEEKHVLYNDFIKYKANKGVWNGVNSDELYVVKYFGTYNGCEAIVIWSTELDSTDDMKFVSIDKYTINLASGNYELLLHRNSSFITVVEAYNKGYLSKDDIEKICYYSKH